MTGNSFEYPEVGDVHALHPYEMIKTFTKPARHYKTQLYSQPMFDTIDLFQRHMNCRIENDIDRRRAWVGTLKRHREFDIHPTPSGVQLTKA
jgi:hypothetical protein